MDRGAKQKGSLITALLVWSGKTVAHEAVWLTMACDRRPTVVRKVETGSLVIFSDCQIVTTNSNAKRLCDVRGLTRRLAPASINARHGDWLGF